MESLEERIKYYRAVFTNCGKYIDDAHCLNENRPEGKRIECEYCAMEFIREKTIKEFAERLKAYIDRNEVQTTYFGGKCFIDKETIDEIAKEFGVETAICKNTQKYANFENHTSDSDWN